MIQIHTHILFQILSTYRLLNISCNVLLSYCWDRFFFFFQRQLTTYLQTQKGLPSLLSVRNSGSWCFFNHNFTPLFYSLLCLVKLEEGDRVHVAPKNTDVSGNTSWDDTMMIQWYRPELCDKPFWIGLVQQRNYFYLLSIKVKILFKQPHVASGCTTLGQAHSTPWWNFRVENYCRKAWPMTY